MKHILIIRFSALGDVAISIPVIKAFIEQNRDVKITVLTKKNCVQLFSLIPNIEVIAPDLKQDYKGIFGLYRLFRAIKKEYQIDTVIDLHQVLRTQILSIFFGLSGIGFFKIDKGRSEKRKLVQKDNKVYQPLKTSSERYADVFIKAGFKLDLKQLPQATDFSLDEQVSQLIGNKIGAKIGIAPFAFYAEKAYPIEKMEEVIAQIDASGKIDIYLFGGGKTEKQIAEDLEEKYKRVHSVIGKLNMKQELSLINQMSVMLTMDSANMHLAALTQTQIISIWGATHPYAGFTAFNHSDESDMIQIPVSELPCRPCSVFGNKKCFRNDLACMNRIEPKTIVQKLIGNC